MKRIIFNGKNLIALGGIEKEPINSLIIIETEYGRPIGSEHPQFQGKIAEDIGETTVLKFNNTDSIQVVIEELKKLKKIMDNIK